MNVWIKVRLTVCSLYYTSKTCEFHKFKLLDNQARGLPSSPGSEGTGGTSSCHFSLGRTWRSCVLFNHKVGGGRASSPGTLASDLALNPATPLSALCWAGDLSPRPPNPAPSFASGDNSAFPVAELSVRISGTIHGKGLILAAVTTLKRYSTFHSESQSTTRFPLAFSRSPGSWLGKLSTTHPAIINKQKRRHFPPRLKII